MANVNEKLLSGAGVADLWRLVKEADAESRAQIDNLLGSYTRIQTGSYAGTGTYGEANKNSLTFDFVPQLVIIGDSAPTTYKKDGNTFSNTHMVPVVFINGVNQSTPSTAGKNGAVWDNKTLSWYDRNSSSSSSPGNQLNTTGSTYLWVAFG